MILKRDVLPEATDLFDLITIYRLESFNKSLQLHGSVTILLVTVNLKKTAHQYELVPFEFSAPEGLRAVPAQ